MKNIIKAFIAVFFATFLCIFGSTAAFAWHEDTERQDITVESAPEGTAFVDILVKDKWHDKYEVDFNEENGELLGVGRDCGLAEYSEGYTSLLLRHDCAIYRTEENRQFPNYFELREENQKLYNYYRSIKVAYCDKNGNILGVTEAVEIERVIFTAAGYRITADGESLTYRMSKAPPYWILILFYFVIPPLVIILIVVFAIIITINKKKKKQTIERIQSGEVENDREQQ